MDCVERLLFRNRSIEGFGWMVRTLVIPVIALSGCLLGACSALPVPAPVSASEPAEYQIGTGDDLKVAIYGEPNLSGEYHVSAEGRISMPLVGDVIAQGLTVSELQKAIAHAYAAGGFLTNPVAAVDMLNYRAFYVLGEVNAPGSYPFVPGMTVQQAIATSKGYTYRARKSLVMVTHRGDAKEAAMRLAPGVAVLPGDTIRVLERHF